jgi:molybdenum cofactor biosynthesis protein B
VTEQADPSHLPKGSPVAEHRRTADRVLRLGVLTVSDTRTLETDVSGQLLVDRFAAAGHTIVERQIVRDEVEEIREVVRRAQATELDALLITGGTGLAPRDCTPEAIEPLLEVKLPGFGELFRMLSYAEIGAAAMLSRAVAGRVGRVLVFCLPGSTAAVRLAVDKLLLSDLAHLVHHSRD